MDILDVYIGFDSREPAAYHVCQQSMIRHATLPVNVRAITRDEMQIRGLYHRRWRSGNEPGVVVDCHDNRPFSTEFAFTRFLVPRLHSDLAMLPHRQWALFCDCDFLFRADVGELYDFMDDDKAVVLVKHQYEPRELLKMDGQPQRPYPRKNWSSFVLWNCAHPAHEELTLTMINTQPGRWLHAFSWLQDEQIGALPEAWNWLEGWSAPDINPKAVHFTRGGPWFRRWRGVRYAEEWCGELELQGMGV